MRMYLYYMLFEAGARTCMMEIGDKTFAASHYKAVHGKTLLQFLLQSCCTISGEFITSQLRNEQREQLQGYIILLTEKDPRLA